MTNLIEAIALTLFAWTATMLLLSWSLSLVYPLVRSWLVNYPAAIRTYATLSFSLTPHILATLLLVVYSQPKLSAYLVTSHCHDDICGPHWLHMPVSTLPGMGTVAVSVALLGIIILMVWRQLRNGRRQLSALHAFSRRYGKKDYRLLETQKPMAWCAGYFKPTIYLSRGLLNQLKPEHLDAVIAHELSHAVNHDNLRKLLVHWATLVWPKTKKMQIRRDFSNDTECTCDMEAIHHRDVKSLEETIQFIEDFCTNGTQNSATQGRSKRLSNLQRELDLHGNGSKFQQTKRLEVMAIVVLIWLIMLLVIGHFGHPLLEWLYR